MEFEIPCKSYTSSDTEPVHKNFQELFLKIVQAKPNKPLTESNRSLVQDHLHELLSRYKTPDHPPYHEMIERAIRELNEEGGSRIETISKFLMKEHNSLPWAHSLLLKRHLVQLCDSGDIVMTWDKYMLSGVYSSKFTRPNSKRNRLMTGWSSRIGMREKRMCEKPVVETRKHHQETVPSQATKSDIWAPRK